LVLYNIGQNLCASLNAEAAAVDHDVVAVMAFFKSGQYRRRQFSLALSTSRIIFLQSLNPLQGFCAILSLAHRVSK
jgi:hypothetical protein